MAHPVLFDLGPAPAPTLTDAAQRSAVLVLAPLQATPALADTALRYRLAYHDARQWQAYAQARWSMVPAALVQQRLHQHLGHHYTVLLSGQGAAQAACAPVLHLQLLEFSHTYVQADQSHGAVQLRATLSRQCAHQPALLVQRVFEYAAPATRADAAAGVQALAQAVDGAAASVQRWLGSVLEIPAAGQ